MAIFEKRKTTILDCAGAACLLSSRRGVRGASPTEKMRAGRPRFRDGLGARASCPPIFMVAAVVSATSFLCRRSWPFPKRGADGEGLTVTAEDNRRLVTWTVLL
jgi:hypothetical protein